MPRGGKDLFPYHEGDLNFSTIYPLGNVRESYTLQCLAQSLDESEEKLSPFAISSEAISKGMHSKADISNIPYGHTSYCFFACGLHIPKI